MNTIKFVLKNKNLTMQNTSSVSHTDSAKQKFFTFDRWLAIIGMLAFVIMMAAYFMQKKIIFGNCMLVFLLCGAIATVRIKISRLEDPLFTKVVVILIKVFLLAGFCIGIIALFNQLYR